MVAVSSDESGTGSSTTPTNTTTTIAKTTEVAGSSSSSSSSSSVVQSKQFVSSSSLHNHTNSNSTSNSTEAMSSSSGSMMRDTTKNNSNDDGNDPTTNMDDSETSKVSLSSSYVVLEKKNHHDNDDDHHHTTAERENAASLLSQQEQQDVSLLLFTTPTPTPATTVSLPSNPPTTTTATTPHVYHPTTNYSEERSCTTVSRSSNEENDDDSKRMRMKDDRKRGDNQDHNDEEYDANYADYQDDDYDNDDDEDNDRMDIDSTTKRDTKHIVRLKILVMLILITSATVVSIVVYNYIVHNETHVFLDQYNNDVAKIFAAVCASLERTLNAMNAISITLVSYAKDQNDTWPYVTLPDFALHASKLVPLTDGVYVAVVPVVTPEERRSYELYAYDHDYWVNEALALQEVWDGYNGDIVYNFTRNHSIYSAFGDIEDNVTRYMLPQWQSFPVAPPQDGTKLYHYDWNSFIYGTNVKNCIDNRTVILSESYMLPYPDDDLANQELEVWANFFAAFLPDGEEPFEPMFDMYYPIIDDVSSNAAIGGYVGNASRAVGMLAVPIYWREFFRDILSIGSDGIVIVVTNPCAESFTYQIMGPEVVYLGVGDKHDPKYDDYVRISSVAELKSYAVQDGLYRGPPIDLGYCPHTFYLYPSDMMKDDYMTNDAIMFLLAFIFIFSFTTLVFFIYDCYVERRQHRVKSAAMHSSAIVSSLFPSTVRDLIYPKTTPSPPKTMRRLSGFGGTTSTALATTSTSSHVDAATNGNTTPIIGSPIAQVYPETTVIFADIVGFTAWSSIRDPIQVFHLLETIYAGFDALARIHGVFKIETIGDSYVAVVGLPKSRKRHAVVMARFANAIRNKMKEMTTELEKTLGEGTSNLAIRIGLNSGPTTAGVLRGEKARFQLFGDTVNTASRMESNGKPYKIHVSETTAELLKAAGKGHWLLIREEMIVAKGKGMMQTYWCEPSNDNTASYDDCSEQFLEI